MSEDNLEDIPEKILEDSHLVSLAQSMVFASQDSVEELLERLYKHNEKIPYMANVLLFTMFGKFWNVFCQEISRGQEDLSIVIFEAVNAVMNEEKFAEFMQTMALNPFIMMSGSGDF